MAIAQNSDWVGLNAPATLVHGVRMAFLILVLLMTFLVQVIERNIFSYEAFLPIYTLIGLSLILQGLYLLFLDSISNKKVLSGVMFGFEAIYITLLVYFVGVQQSLFLFLFLVNILMCGLLFQRQGALALAFFTSLLFTFTLSLDDSIRGHTVFLAIGVNNMAFFAVAYLSGFMSEQFDILGRRLSETRLNLRTLRNLNSLVLSNMNSGLLTMDHDGLIVQANAFACRFFSTDRLEFVGKKLGDFIPNLSVNPVLEKEIPSFAHRIEVSGVPKEVRLHFSQLVLEGEQPSGFIITFQDETQLHQLEARVRQSEKLAAIGQLAAGIAHEIRNPLASISGSIQLMESNSPQSPEDQKLMTILHREIDRLNRLIGEFLDYAKPEAPMEDSVDLSQLLREIVEFSLLGPEYKSVSKELEASHPVFVRGNRDKLKQAFLNIIVNAIQAMTREDNQNLLIRVIKNDEGGQVVIKDSGCGMTPEQVSKIFEPFHTTKHKGTGLGLAITHSIIESHGASVSVESQVNQGTQFTISFDRHKYSDLV